MALDTVIARTLLRTLTGIDPAYVGLVTGCTHAVEMPIALRHLRLRVWIVARRARERPRFRVASAQVQLLDVPDDRHRLIGAFEIVVLAKILKRQTGSIVTHAASSPHDRGAGAKMALLTHRLGEFAPQMTRIDNRVIDGRQVVRLGVCVMAQVQFARAVTAFAADGRFDDAHAMQAALERLGVSRMAHQATLANRTLEPWMIRHIIARRHAPRLARRVPGDRRLDEE